MFRYQIDPLSSYLCSLCTKCNDKKVKHCDRRAICVVGIHASALSMKSVAKASVHKQDSNFE